MLNLTSIEKNERRQLLEQFGRTIYKKARGYDIKLNMKDFESNLIDDKIASSLNFYIYGVNPMLHLDSLNTAKMYHYLKTEYKCMTVGDALNKIRWHDVEIVKMKEWMEQGVFVNPLEFSAAQKGYMELGNRIQQIHDIVWKGIFAEMEREY